jgi:hypothetical protein
MTIKRMKIKLKLNPTEKVKIKIKKKPSVEMFNGIKVNVWGR